MEQPKSIEVSGKENHICKITCIASNKLQGSGIRNLTRL